MYILFKLLKFTLVGLVHLVIYPVFYIMYLFRCILNKSDSNLPTSLQLTLNTLKLCGWFVCVVVLSSSFYDNNIMLLMESVASLISTGELKYTDKPVSSSGVYGNSSNTGGVTINGSNYTFDFKNIPSSVQLPAGSYQTGTPYQRAELLVICQEICARPEITISPEILLGLFYNETSAYIPFKDSLVSGTWSQTLDKDSCGGPFCISTSLWASNGTAFVSSLESGKEARVLTNAEAKSKTTITGLSRPCMFYFPDAAYTAAKVVSQYYPASKCGSGGHWTKDVSAWGKKLGMTDYTVDILEINSALAYYNSYGTNHKTYIPAMYADITKQYGKVNQWSNLASNRDTLTNKLLYDIIPKLKRTYPSFNPSEGFNNMTYEECRNNGNKVAIKYQWIVHNGGKWVYDSLCALGEKIGKDNSNTSNSTSPGANTSSIDMSSGIPAPVANMGCKAKPDRGPMTQQEFERIYKIGRKYLGTPYSLNILDPPNHFCCASYISYICKEAGYKTVSSNLAYVIYEQVMPITKEQLRPGDLIFQKYTYKASHGHAITHVMLYIGNNQALGAQNEKLGTILVDLKDTLNSKNTVFGRIKG